MTGKNNLGKVTMVIVLSLVSLLVVVPGALALTNSDDVYYRVQAGDSLWLIGWKFEVTADAVKNANSLKTTQLVPGQVLRVPKWTVPIRPLPKSFQYTVNQGDTLYLIGQRFGVSATKIREASRLSGTTIYPGQTITVPLPLQTRYTVQSGDTLALLSQKFGITIETLKIVNKMNSTILWVGQVLFVPDKSTTPGAVTPPTGTNPPASGTQTPPTPIPPDSGTPTPPDSGTPIPPDSGTQTPPDNTGTTPQTETPPSEPAPGGSTQPQIPVGGQWGEMPSGVILYHVAFGDNLWLIANRYHTTIAAIMATNHLHSDLIQVNQPLFIKPESTQAVTIPYPAAPVKEGFGEYMDWEYVSWIFDSHNFAVIQDVDTGKTFQVRRLGGSNHADCEPVSSADTAIMKEIYGGQWSWATRAVLVHVDGKVIAGSMAGMPHSIEDITDNGFTGHFDLHFLNSKRHVDNTIDPEHQAMVRKAAGY